MSLRFIYMQRYKIVSSHASIPPYLFQVRLKMREIGSVADYLDFGGIVEGRFMHIAPLRDAHFGEAGANSKSTNTDLHH